MTFFKLTILEGPSPISITVVQYGREIVDVNASFQRKKDSVIAIDT